MRPWATDRRTPVRYSRRMAKTAAMFAFLLLVGCTSAGVAYSWRGEPVAGLITAWGAPATDTQLADGGREISYTAEQKDEEAFASCVATFQTGTDGIIVSADDGLAGCNRLLEGKPANVSSSFTVGVGLQFMIIGR